jgi:hypothetical protein
MRAPKDLICGLLLAGFGAAYFWLAHAYGMGTTSRMGPGYFPRALGALLVVLGLAMAARSFVVAGTPIERFTLRPFVVLSTAVILFGVLLRPAGLVVAVIVLVVVGSFARAEWRWRDVLLLAVGLAAGATVAFPIILGLPLPILPRI